MPILAPEPDIYPADLFDIAEQGAGDPSPQSDNGPSWWALYTMSRREKDLMRRLHKQEIPFYCPIIPKRNRSPAGRIRISHVPLFSNYVFVYGDEMQRYLAVSTGCVSQHLEVVDGDELTQDLRQIHELILAGVPLTPEARLAAGDFVRVRTGPFKGYEGTVLRREGQMRLLVAVNFLQQGASVLLEDCQLDVLYKADER
jgi:transcriptional antiterminator RfaH